MRQVVFVGINSDHVLNVESGAYFAVNLQLRY